MLRRTTTTDSTATIVGLCRGGAFVRFYIARRHQVRALLEVLDIHEFDLSLLSTTDGSCLSCECLAFIADPDSIPFTISQLDRPFTTLLTKGKRCLALLLKENSYMPSATNVARSLGVGGKPCHD